MCWKKAGFLHICHSYGCVCGNRKNGIYVKNPKKARRALYTESTYALSGQWGHGSRNFGEFCCVSAVGPWCCLSWVIGILEASAKWTHVLLLPQSYLNLSHVTATATASDKFECRKVAEASFVLALDAPLKFSLLKEEREAGDRFQWISGFQSGTSQKRIKTVAVKLPVPTDHHTHQLLLLVPCEF